MNEKPHHIYVLIDPRDGEIRYIGRTTDTKKRLQQHCKPTGSIRAGNENDWIGELRSLGLSPEMKVVETVDNQFSARLRERAWIKHYQSHDNKLSNAPKLGRPKQ